MSVSLQLKVFSVLRSVKAFDNMLGSFKKRGDIEKVLYLLTVNKFVGFQEIFAGHLFGKFQLTFIEVAMETT